MRPLTLAGGYGVDLFFILSGVILCYRYESEFRSVHRPEYERFLLYRIARIYPVHLAATALIGAGLVAAKVGNIEVNNSYSATSLVGSLLLVDAWSPRAKHFGWNYPAWSISAEWFAYLTFPFAARLTAKLRTPRPELTAVICALALFIVLVPGFEMSWPLIRIATEFSAGVFLAHLLRHPTATKTATLAVLGSLAVIAIAVVAVEKRLQLAILVVGFAGLIFGLAKDEGPVSRFLSRPILVTLGEASYALYMTHAIVEMFGTRVIAFDDHVESALPLRLAIVGLYVAAIGVMTAGMFVLVERPGRRIVRKMGDRLIRNSVGA